MNPICSILLLGGARSGKSRTAQHWALTFSSRPVYLATSRRWDDEHAARIERHRNDRGPEWITIEEPLELSKVTAEHPVIVVDCVTLWLTNVFESAGYDLDRALAIARAESKETCHE